MQDPLYIEPTKTIITEIDIIHAVKQAYRNLFGTEASLETLSILCAQIFFECGRGKACFNYNLGNVKRTTGHTWTMYKCSEYIKGVLTYFQPPHVQTMFNSYSSLPDAAEEHLRFLNSSRYQAALKEAQNGNVEQYCLKLKKAGYFTDTIEHYTKVMVSICEEIKNKYVDEVMNDPYEDQ